MALKSYLFQSAPTINLCFFSSDQVERKRREKEEQFKKEKEEQERREQMEREMEENRHRREEEMRYKAIFSHFKDLQLKYYQKIMSMYQKNSYCKPWVMYTLG